MVVSARKSRCPSECRNFTPGSEYSYGQCRICWLEHHNPRYSIDRKPIQQIGKPEPTCPHLGEPTGGKILCPSCRGKVELKVFACVVHGQCVQDKHPEGIQSCDGCKDRPAVIVPLSVQRIDKEKLKVGRVGEAFNSSLIRYKGRLLLCYRTGWAGARLHVAELNKDMVPVKVTTLNHLGHPRATVGQEDPRLFIFRDRLHVSFTGVERTKGGVVTNVLYARLTDDFRVDEVFAPVYFGRRSWEKNWTFFEWENELFCIYSIAPHVILHVRGNQAYPFAETQTAFPWSGGHLRGGCSPVRVGDTFYHWFHGRIGGWGGGTYNVGLYTFPAKPPFAIERMTPDPLMTADHSTKPPDQTWEPAVVFPAGSVLERGEWSISMGVHDRFTDVAKWSAAEVDKLLGIEPQPAPIEGDIILSSAFLHCGDQFGVMPAGRTDRVPLKSLTDAEMMAYFRTLTYNAETYKAQTVLLHDGLPQGVIDGLVAKGVRCVLVKPDTRYAPYESRWFVYRDFLAEHRHLVRVWFVDAGDVVFTSDPFDYLDRDVIATGLDEVPYRECPWHRGQLDHLPPSWSESLTFDYPPNAGTWGASRELARRIVAETCVRIEEAYDHFSDHPLPNPIVTDMAAFGLAVQGRAMKQFPRKGGKPLFHDRVLCDQFLNNSSIVS